MLALPEGKFLSEEGPVSSLGMTEVIGSNPVGRRQVWLVAPAALLVLYAALALRLAWTYPAGPYFHDEKFNMENVQGWASGELRPSNSWYSPLTWVPQALAILAIDALRGAGFEALPAMFQQGLATDDAYRVARTVGVAYGVGGLALAWRLGLQLFGAAPALFGLAVAASSPWVIRAGVEFKPDSAVLLTSVLALWGLLAARRQPTLLRFFIAGSLLGLLVSAKLTGVFLALLLPLVVMTTPVALSVARRIGFLAAAGSAALATYLVTAPFLMDSLWYFGRIERHYGRKGDRTFVEMLWTALGELTSWNFLGPWIGVLGFVACAYWLVRPRRHPEDLDRSFFALSAVVYLVLISLLTRYYKANNYPHLVPLLGVLAGSTGKVVAELFVSFGSRVRQVVIVACFVLGVALAGQMLWNGSHYVYTETVQTVEDQAKEVLRPLLQRLGTLIVWVEVPPEKPLPVVESRDQQNVPIFSGLIPTPDLKRIGLERLALADAVYFPASRLREPGGDLYRSWIDSVPPPGRKSLAPRFGRLRGEAHFLLLRPWEPTGPAIPIALSPQPGSEWWKIGRPNLEAGTIASLLFQVWDPQLHIEVRRDGLPLPLLTTRFQSQVSFSVTTERWASQPGEVLELRFPSSLPQPERVEAWIQTWIRREV